MTRSPRRLTEQVKETVSELPIHAARLAVMGVGRALLLTDRVRKDYREARQSGLGPVLGRLKNDAGHLTGMVVGKVAGNGKTEEETTSRAADSEISVGKPKPAAPGRPATSSRPATAPPPARPETAARPKPAAPKRADAKPKPTAATKPSEAKPAPKPAAKPAAKATASEAKAPAKATEDLPITGYDEATLASVRARLRGLDVKQVGELRDYERSHAARADFLRMYENRIAKLRGER